MGFLRGAFVLLFPFLATVIALVLSLIIFFSSYKGASALKTVNFLTVDFGDLNIQGISLTKLLGKQKAATAFGVGVNGICVGTSPSEMSQCMTPNEPFYFDLKQFFEMSGQESLYKLLPDDLRKYDSIMKGVSLGIWGCFLATICLCALQLVVGFFAIFSVSASRIAELFATLGLFAAIIGSGLATGMYGVVRNKLNDLASEIGVHANWGSTGLGIAWATAAALFIADILYVMSRCFAGRNRRYVAVPDKGSRAYVE